MAAATRRTRAGARREVRHLVFPPLHHADDPRFHNPILQHPLMAAGPQRPAALRDEVIAVPEHLLPSGDDLEQDTLPMEQHPSYPLGNPYWIHHTPATLQPAGSSQPKLDPRLAMRLAMHMDTHAPEDALSSVARGSAHAQAALEERDDEGPLPYSVGADGHVTLAPHLRLKAQMGASPAPPAWPFPRYGPGPSARPHAALFRRPAGTEPDESVWADLALEALVPRARPDSYSLPSTLMHTYAKDAQGRRRRERPSGMPSTLGALTRRHDSAWLDEAWSDDDVDATWERELHDWAAADVQQARERVRPRRVSSLWMQEQHDFHRVLLSVLEPTARAGAAGARPKRVREPAASPAHGRRKRRSISVPLELAPSPPLDRWVWGASHPGAAAPASP
ncbi:Uncharacterized protein MSYG_2392 [Malassezia sympodialis ATCC 42132]|uniref:Uncharacterized protein n=1 Tax=Malassezia sympodialis (strain ATCC 42132) TaxID=1230383 RepID=A0A1M8A6F4_MALS4|nr:Uncharacterized protein MSYG_2392 [Malassezia sympodialis ATCC 42132]